MPDHDPPLLEDVDVRYGRGTSPQGYLPFHIRIRRRYRWWPAPVRYGKITDLLLLSAALCPGIVWTCLCFGWLPVTFVMIELIIIRLTIYRAIKGTFFD
jgi:hypothetical protein